MTISFDTEPRSYIADTTITEIFSFPVTGIFGLRSLFYVALFREFDHQSSFIFGFTRVHHHYLHSLADTV